MSWFIEFSSNRCWNQYFMRFKVCLLEVSSLLPSIPLLLIFILTIILLRFSAFDLLFFSFFITLVFSSKMGFFGMRIGFSNFPLSVSLLIVRYFLSLSLVRSENFFYFDERAGIFGRLLKSDQWRRWSQKLRVFRAYFAWSSVIVS